MMMPLRRIWSVFVIVLFALVAIGRSEAATTAGVVISNTATATLTDGNGVVTTLVSNTISATVAAVSGVIVGLKESGCHPAVDAFAAGLPVTRTFAVTNVSNISDAYTISATTSAGKIASIAIVSGATQTPIANDATTPQLAPGASLQFLVTIATTGVPVGTNIAVSLAAKSTALASANGRATDVAAQCAIAVGGVALVGPAGPTSPISKLVNGSVFASLDPGSSVTYSIRFTNNGGVAAQNVIITDDVPVGVTPKLATVAIDGTVTQSVSLVGQRLVVKIGQVAAQEPVLVTFDATVDRAAPLGNSYVNTAVVTSDTTAPSVTTTASVLIGAANVVYDGYLGASAPVAGAAVSLIDPKTDAPVAFGPIGIAPNTANTDPYLTGGDGKYSFDFTPQQVGLGTQAGSVTYVITIAAPGYLNRRIGLVLRPDATGTLFSATLTSFDGEPLSISGGFSLTTKQVSLANLFGLFGNLPVFRAQNIQIEKTVDRSFAASGDRLQYALNFSNIATPLAATTIVDTLPAGVAYAPGTGRIDGLDRLEPSVSGRTLTWTLTTLTRARVITYAAVILPGVAENSILTNNVTIAATPQNAPSVTLRANASVDTRVIAGVFTDRTIVTGRVFLDVARSGYFERSDVGIENVRVFLEDGESVVTDRFGRYSFPGVRPGMHVLRVDTTTLPPTSRAYRDRNFESQKSVRRLVHGVFDGGIIEDINFAIAAKP